MKNILVITENPISPYGGIERHCYNIYKMFSRNGVCIQTASTDNIEYSICPVISKKVFKSKRLADYIAACNCDIVHVHGFASITVWQALNISSNLHKKVIWTPHFHPFFTLERPLLGFLFYHILLRPLLSRVSTVVCINNEDKKFFSRYYGHTIMLPNWLSVDLPVPQVIAKKKNMILFVGRNDSNKSPYYLLNLPRGKYEIHCVTDNSKGLRDDFIIHQKISDKELAELYSYAALLVAPSRYEAFSYVVLEALNYSTPVLISDRVRIIDHLEGISGITVFNYGNKKDFVDKIDNAMSQVVDVESVRNIFSEKKAFVKLLNLYTDI